MSKDSKYKSATYKQKAYMDEHGIYYMSNTTIAEASTLITDYQNVNPLYENKHIMDCSDQDDSFN